MSLGDFNNDGRIDYEDYALSKMASGDDDSSDSSGGGGSGGDGGGCGCGCLIVVILILYGIFKLFFG